VSEVSSVELEPVYSHGRVSVEVWVVLHRAGRKD
jgi:hypothetical protein